MKRTLLLGALLGAYIAALVRPDVGGADGRPLDPLAPQPREVELAIGTGRFEEALPLALDLQRTRPQEPLAAYWLGTIYRGLDRAADEAAAWQRYVELSPAPAAACPSIAEAYERLGEIDRALREYERCAGYEPQDPARLIDLAEAAERAGNSPRALAAYRLAQALDSGDPAIAAGVLRLSAGPAATP